MNGVKRISDFLILLLIFYQNANAQLTEDFTDGDFNNNPVWQGDTSAWLINGNAELQSNSLVANSNFYLSTASDLATDAQWEFTLRITFNPSSVNYADVYLTASAFQLSQVNTNGYFVRIGGTEDEIALYRRDGPNEVKLIEGTNGALNSSNNLVTVKVTRTILGMWTLSRIVNGGPVFTEGEWLDNSYTTSACFGILVKQSSSSFFQKHFFDAIRITHLVPDTTIPLLTKIIVHDQQSASLLFNEPVSALAAANLTHFHVSNGIGNPVSAQRDSANNAMVHLRFSDSFPERQVLQITILDMSDLAGNINHIIQHSFAYFVPTRMDVLITEIMADPSPVVGLPDAEWIEIRNNTVFDIDLQGWKLNKASAETGPFPSYILQPDSAIVVCSSSAASLMNGMANSIVVPGFPSLSNTGDVLFLVSATGGIIHTVAYTDEWYKNAIKRNGGWSLEMMDVQNPCAGEINWAASNHPLGATPGRANSVKSVVPDIKPPKLLHAYPTDSMHLWLVFDEPLDSLFATTPGNYSISENMGHPLSVLVLGPLFKKVMLQLNAPLRPAVLYSITVSGIKDCIGNNNPDDQTTSFGLPQQADSFDIVINEILFNPGIGVTDYAEIYNRSDKIIDLKNCYIANRSTTGEISNIVAITTDCRLLLPGKFMLLTEDEAAVKQAYSTMNSEVFIDVQLPSFNDDEGHVILLNEQGLIIDQLHYNESWHFKLLNNKEGVALERTIYDAPTQDEQNWHSAASSVGYGTPGYKNSQWRALDQSGEAITVEPRVFSPDNDGFNDLLSINYHFPEPGYLISIHVFDGAGRKINSIRQNALAGTSGYFTWDGLGFQQAKLPQGLYIVYTEIFNLKGRRKKFKNVVVLARKQ